MEIVETNENGATVFYWYLTFSTYNEAKKVWEFLEASIKEEKQGEQT